MAVRKATKRMSARHMGILPSYGPRHIKNVAVSLDFTVTLWYNKLKDGDIMGLSLTSIHISGNALPKNCELCFSSFSDGWLTCTDEISDEEPKYAYKAAKAVSKCTDSPVLYFNVFDGDIIYFEFFLNGKSAARYSNEELVANKKLYDIPSLAGYESGHKKRLSAILACSDVDLKISMLEEFFGVCLLYIPELSDNRDMLFRKKDDAVYLKYLEHERSLTGKSAPIAIEQIAEYPGKIFYHKFNFLNEKRDDTFKPHFFLYGYETENSDMLTPVRFTGKGLEKTDHEAFSQGRISMAYPYKGDTRFIMDYGTPTRVTFSDECPSEYRGRTMELPNGFYPHGFLTSNELVLRGTGKIYIADPTLKIIAKLSIKGELADIEDDCLLTYSGDSFCGYCFEKGAKVYVYRITKKTDKKI